MLESILIDGLRLLSLMPSSARESARNNFSYAKEFNETFSSRLQFIHEICFGEKSSRDFIFHSKSFLEQKSDCGEWKLFGEWTTRGREFQKV